MSKLLPTGWIQTTLGNICIPVESIKPELTPTTEFTYIDIGSIDNQSNRIVEPKTITGRSAPSRARQAVRKGDILFSTVRTYLKNIARIEVEYVNPVCSTAFTVIRLPDAISRDFIFFQLLTEAFLDELNKRQTGTTYPAVRGYDVLSQPILIAPRTQQESIAAKLTTAFTRIENAERATRRAQERLKRYGSAVLHSAIRGDLTSAWRETYESRRDTPLESGPQLLRQLLEVRRQVYDSSDSNHLRGKTKKYKEPTRGTAPKDVKLPSTWTWASADQCTSLITDGEHITPKRSSKGVLLLSARNVLDGRLKLDEVDYISETEYKRLSKRLTVSEGDVLLTCSGTLGRSCVVPPGFRFALVRSVAVLKPLLNIGVFLSFALRSDLLQRQIFESKSQTVQANIFQRQIRALMIPLPSLLEQNEINREVTKRLHAADVLSSKLQRQLKVSTETRSALLRNAFSGKLVFSGSSDQSADELLAVAQEQVDSARRKQIELKRSAKARSAHMQEASQMDKLLSSAERLTTAFDSIGQKPDANRLFAEAGFRPEEVISFYEELRANSRILNAFRRPIRGNSITKRRRRKTDEPKVTSFRFRLNELWLEDFKNLKDYLVTFGPSSGLDVVLGWNGTGKSNLFEALVVIFRDLHEWSTKGKWPKRPMCGFRLTYEIEGQETEVSWDPSRMKRPEVLMRRISSAETPASESKQISRKELLLPRFVFGYYSGPTNRLAEHFLPMKQAHYVRLRDAKSDDPETLATLLEQRRFFCAETHHAKYVLLSFCYREDEKINLFLRERLRIVGFESVLFVVREPRWKRNNDPHDFWGATGVMRRVLKRLQRFAIAPLVVEQSVRTGFRNVSENHYYFFLPDRKSLEVFAAEYDDARTFFLALESTDFSELIHDVLIQVRIMATNDSEATITFHEMSEGEQQLLMVLGLMRFTKSNQSLVLLDEPDTHLNPQWSVDYLTMLSRLMSDDGVASMEQQTSQILMTTHDPLVIASLLKEQIHLLKRDPESLACFSDHARESPRGMGYSGILMSEIFGFRSDLDPETLALLDVQADIAAKEGPLSKSEQSKLRRVNSEIEKLGFKSISSDPYYREFLGAMVRNRENLRLLKKETQSPTDRETLKNNADEIFARLTAKFTSDS